MNLCNNYIYSLFIVNNFLILYLLLNIIKLLFSLFPELKDPMIIERFCDKLRNKQFIK